MKGQGDIFRRRSNQIFFKGFYNYLKYFLKSLHARNQEIKLNMPKNYGSNTFWDEFLYN
jgi:hypothetical protein